MRGARRRLAIVAAVAAVAAVALPLAVPAVVAADELVIRAGRIFPVAAAPIDDGVIVVRDGRIAAIGAAGAVATPAGARELRAAVVTPGLVDAHAVVGFAGIYNSSEGQVQDQDQLERSDPVQPELRAVDAYDPLDPLVGWVRSLGVTTVHTGHGPGAVVSGQTLVAKTRGGRVEQVVIRPAAALAATLGTSVQSNFDSPGTAAKTAAMLRDALVAAEAYRTKRRGDDPPDRDLGHEALVGVLDGELALMITANRASQIATALRLQREFGFELWLAGAAEVYRVFEPVREAGVPVLLHATMARPEGDSRNVSYATAGRLADRGIPFALQTGYENYVPKARVLLYEAQVAVRHGLSPDAALRAITLDPARILGVDDRVGSLEPGKDADLALFDGDPFEYTTHVCTVLIEGEIVSDVCR